MKEGIPLDNESPERERSPEDFQHSLHEIKEERRMELKDLEEERIENYLSSCAILLEGDEHILSELLETDTEDENAMEIIRQKLLNFIIRRMKNPSVSEEDKKRIDQNIDSTRYREEEKRIEEEARRKLKEVIVKNHSTN